MNNVMAQFMEPCDGELTYSEDVTRFGARFLRQTCACGHENTHLLKDESAIRYPHCERSINREQAIEGMSEYLLCHRKGVSYNAYMGFRPDGEEMTDEEYALVKERLDA